MKHISVSLIYITFFVLIGFAIYYTHHPGCLVALIFLPSINVQCDCVCADRFHIEDEDDEISEEDEMDKEDGK